MITVSIVNVTSYTGVELLRLLAVHPDFQVTSVTGRSAVGQQLQDVFPQLRTLSAKQGESATGIDPMLMITDEPAQTDLAFVCLPHAAAAEAVIALLERGTKVIDLSADFRLHDAGVYVEWYKHIHPAPALLGSAVYGLCERYREQIAGAPLVANPGCYATAAILALLPVFTSGIIEPDVIIDAKSGVSGAGRSLTLNTHYTEANEDVSAYSLTGHRHLPEITQELIAGAKAGGHAFAETPGITFVPHLMPMTRGILATCYASMKQSSPTLHGIRLLYEEYYADEPFVHVVDHPPHTKWTYGSNHCFIYPTLDERTGRLIIISCLDNLVKGAAGQAIQNANCQWNLPEATGLAASAVYP